MPYTLTEIEVMQPLPTLSLSERDTGIALIVRRKDKPIGFLIDESTTSKKRTYP